MWMLSCLCNFFLVSKIILLVFWPEWDIMGVRCEVALAGRHHPLSPWNAKVEVTQETFTTVPEGLRSCSPTTAIPRSQCCLTVFGIFVLM